MGNPRNSTTSIISKNCQSCSKNGRTTATRLEFGRMHDAQSAKRRAEESGKRAFLSASRYRTPERMVTIYVVTIRPVPTYEKHAEKQGYGVTGRE